MQPSPIADVWRPCEPSRRVLGVVAVDGVIRSPEDEIVARDLPQQIRRNALRARPYGCLGIVEVNGGAEILADAWWPNRAHRTRRWWAGIDARRRAPGTSTSVRLYGQRYADCRICRNCRKAYGGCHLLSGEEIPAQAVATDGGLHWDL